MTVSEAKEILTLYRPNGPEAKDPAVAEALALAEKDPELQIWWQRHWAWQTSMQQKLRSLPAPLDLPDQILTAAKTVTLPRWKHPSALAMAAALFLLLGLAAHLIFFRNRAEDTFQNFQHRMVSSVLREYRMDIITNRLEAVRQFMSEHEAPSSFEVPAPLAQLPLTGGGLHRWRNHPVSMICYDRGTNQMVFLFVLKRTATSNPVPRQPRLGTVNRLTTASWTRGDWTYFLAAEPWPGFPDKFLPDPAKP